MDFDLERIKERYEGLGRIYSKLEEEAGQQGHYSHILNNYRQTLINIIDFNELYGNEITSKDIDTVENSFLYCRRYLTLLREYPEFRKLELTNNPYIPEWDSYQLEEYINESARRLGEKF